MRSAPVVIALALAVACEDPSGVGLPCAASDNCPDGLVCSSGACASDLGGPGGGPIDGSDDREDARDDDDLLGDDDDLDRPDHPRDPGPSDPFPFPSDPADPVGDPNAPPDDVTEPPVDELPEEPVQPPPPPGWTLVEYDAPLFGTPRVVPDATGVELYFLEGPCVGLARAFTDGTVDLVASPGEGCFVELDAVRDDEVVRVVARRTSNDESAVLFVDVNAAGLVPGSIGFDPIGAGEHRGVRPRVALTQSGTPRWMWSVRQQQNEDLIEQLLVSSSAPTVVADVAGLVDDLDYVVDAANNDALFLTDLNNDRLVLRTQGVTRFLELDVTGPIDAVACGNGVHVAYRFGDELRVTSVEGSFVEDTIVDGGLSSGRTRGDISLACDDGDLWTAFTLANEGVVRLAGPLGSGAIAVEDVAAAKGAVSLAVVDGTRHIAFGSPAGRLRYATRP